MYARSRCRLLSLSLSSSFSHSPVLSLSLPFNPVRARSRARGSSAGIIIMFGKYVFVVTPEVSHPRRGKRARPRLRRHGVGCHGGGTHGGGSPSPCPDLALSLTRGERRPEKEDAAEETRQVRTGTHPRAEKRGRAGARKPAPKRVPRQSTATARNKYRDATV